MTLRWIFSVLILGSYALDACANDCHIARRSKQHTHTQKKSAPPNDNVAPLAPTWTNANVMLMSTKPAADSLSSRNDCSGFYRDAGDNAVVSAPRVEQSTTNYLSVIISGFAILLSIGNIAYTWNKDRRARAQSISDDFWLRKVLSPLSIEPLIVQIAQISANIPEDCSKGIEKSVYREFAQESQQEIQKLITSTHLLNILNNPLCKNVVQCLTDIEDELLDYCGENAGGQNASGFPNKTRQATQTILNEKLFKALNYIKSFQASIV